MATASANSRLTQIENPPKWYVIYTKAGSEGIAKSQLEQKNVPVFLPKISERHYCSEREEVRTKPLFPNYVFANMSFPNDYYKVIWAKGVKRIIGNGQEPVALDDSIVAFLMKQANEKGVIQPLPNLRIRDTVRMKNGPLEGLIGVVDGSLDRRGRIKVLMDFLKEGASIEVPCSLVERL